MPISIIDANKREFNPVSSSNPLPISITGTVSPTIADDTTTNATMYPTWVTAATGNLPIKVSSTKMTFNPSTGALTVGGAISGTTGTFSGQLTALTSATYNAYFGKSSGGDVVAFAGGTASAGAGILFGTAGVAGYTSGYLDATQLAIRSSGGQVGLFTSTGLNNTVIGATTPAAGSFTTLGATGLLTVGGSTPASAAAAGTAGTITWDASYIYVCTATNTWKRVGIATW